MDAKAKDPLTEAVTRIGDVLARAGTDCVSKADLKVLELTLLSAIQNESRLSQQDQVALDHIALRIAKQTRRLEALDRKTKPPL